MREAWNCVGGRSIRAEQDFLKQLLGSITPPWSIVSSH